MDVKVIELSLDSLPRAEIKFTRLAATGLTSRQKVV